MPTGITAAWAEAAAAQGHVRLRKLLRTIGQAHISVPAHSRDIWEVAPRLGLFRLFDRVPMGLDSVVSFARLRPSASRDDRGREQGDPRGLALGGSFRPLILILSHALTLITTFLESIEITVPPPQSSSYSINFIIFHEPCCTKT